VLPSGLLEPELRELPEQDFNWCHTVYGKVEELIPRDTPKPLGKSVTTITYTDANLYHNMLTGRSVTGILHLCNQTLIDWYSKRQATVEPACDNNPKNVSGVMPTTLWGD
jgi:hypothetical protein